MNRAYDDAARACRHAPDPGALALIFADAGAAPKAVMHRLAW